LRVFLTHGRDGDAVAKVRQWFARNHPDVQLIVFSPPLGDPIPTALELQAADADAAIILATPDDVGSLRQPRGSLQRRARQNVWIELGFFWARLGRHRTLLLLRGDGRGLLEIPTDLAGVAYAEFGASLGPASRRLNEFVANCRSMPAEQLTEVLAVSSAFQDRDKEWRDLRASAEDQLWVIGFAMRSQRRWLTFDFGRLEAVPSLGLVYQVVDPSFAAQNRTALVTMHRADAVDDNRTFFSVFLRELERHSDVADRVTLQLHAAAPPFSALVSDPPTHGSEMLVQPFVPRPSEGASDHPRLRLRKRAETGAYQIYWDAIDRAAIEARGTGREATGLAAIRALLDAA